MRRTVIIRFKDGIAEESCYSEWELLMDYLEANDASDLQEILPKMSRVWTEIVQTPEGPKCTGFATLAQVWDVSNFHCDDDRTRARLMQRISTVLEESQGERTVALVFVRPEAEKEWKPMLEQMGGKKADRWVIPTSVEMKGGVPSVSDLAETKKTL